MTYRKCFAILFVVAMIGCGQSQSSYVGVGNPDATEQTETTIATLDVAEVDSADEADSIVAADQPSSDINTPRQQDPAPPAATETPKPDDEGTNGTTQNSAEPSATPSNSPRVRPRSTFRAGGLLDLTFDDLEFNIEKDADFQREMLGEKIEALHGKKVIIRGFILAASVFQQSGIKQFVLVRDNQECCFGPGAYIFHNIQIDMAEGNTADFSIRPVSVEGELAIKPWIGPDDKCYSVFHITADKVK